MSELTSKQHWAQRCTARIERDVKLSGERARSECSINVRWDPPSGLCNIPSPPQPSRSDPGALFSSRKGQDQVQIHLLKPYSLRLPGSAAPGSRRFPSPTRVGVKILPLPHPRRLQVIAKHRKTESSCHYETTIDTYHAFQPQVSISGLT